MIEFREISDRADELLILERFYHELYVSEFLVVGKQTRGSGLGRELLERTETILSNDAGAIGKKLFCVVAEMNDPFKPGALDDCFDPFLRAVIWQKWGYGRLDFPYVQPAL